MKKHIKISILFLISLALFGCQQSPNSIISPNTTPTNTQNSTSSQTLLNNSSAEVINSNLLTLSPNISAQIPENWNITLRSSSTESKSFLGQTPFGPLSFRELFVQEWLKTQNDIASVYSEDLKAINFLKNVYNHQAITSDDTQQLENIEEELFGFVGSVKDARSAVAYFESDDKTFRGISFYILMDSLPDYSKINPEYHIVLYNSEKNIIVSSTYDLTDTKELKIINKPLDEINGAGTASPDKTKIFLEAVGKFKKLVETTSRKDLSFDSDLYVIDSFFRSIAVHS